MRYIIEMISRPPNLRGQKICCRIRTRVRIHHHLGPSLHGGGRIARCISHDRLAAAGFLAFRCAAASGGAEKDARLMLPQRCIIHNKVSVRERARKEPAAHACSLTRAIAPATTANKNQPSAAERQHDAITRNYSPAERLN